MTPLAELIAKLEATTEGSRELDALIGLAIGFNATLLTNGETAAQAFVRVPTDLRGIARAFEYPQWSASLDAALTLVPEGFAWSVGKSRTAMADVNKWGEISERGAAPTAPLALCIAALKARQASQPAKGD